MKAEFLTPVVTIFDEEGNLDKEGNKKVYDYLIDGGVDGLVIMGSTGEFFNMSMDMQKELIDLVTSHVNKRVKVFIGTSRMCIDESIELSNYAHNSGADGVMIISPYYFSLDDDSIEMFYSEIAKNTEAEIYLYNYPDRTGYDLSPELTLRLVRKHKNIVGYKDTVTLMGHTRDLINTMKAEFPDFKIYSGYDENFIHNLMSGGAGCIGGLSNLIPEVCSKWAEAYNSKDMDKVIEIQKYINKAMDFYLITNPFIPAMKKAMTIRGLQISDYMTAPFIKPNEKQVCEIKKLMNELNIC